MKKKTKVTDLIRAVCNKSSIDFSLAQMRKLHLNTTKSLLTSSK